MPESESGGQQTLGSFDSKGIADENAEDSEVSEIPPRCLSFKVSGPFAHFRRIEGNVVKQTYQIMPRTTIAGMVAAMLGLPRDSYYDLFDTDSSAVAIEPTRNLRTMNLPQLTLTTTNNNDTVGLESHGSRRTVKITIPRPEAARQQHNYQVLVNPAYRIDLWLSDEARYTELREALSAGRSHYTPSLGLSEHLAQIEYLGEHEPTLVDSTEVDVDSALPNSSDNIIAQPDVQWSIERSPAFMESNGRGRVTKGFCSYAFRLDGGPLTAQEVNAARVDDRTVMFV